MMAKATKTSKPQRAKKLSAETLIALATETLKAEIVPGLDADKRFAAAMIANALDIARREITTTDDAALWAILDQAYDDGDGTPVQLAADIRAGTITEVTHPGLGGKLRNVLIAELKVRNPRFLRARGLKI
jgi:Domain of unknown function (DUF6285)